MSQYVELPSGSQDQQHQQDYQPHTTAIVDEDVIMNDAPPLCDSLPIIPVLYQTNPHSVMLHHTLPQLHTAPLQVQIEISYQFRLLIKLGNVVEESLRLCASDVKPY